jgi:hypothetical protein
MGKACAPEIHELHAELVHAAAEIQFVLSYLNGVLPASITDIGEKNVQAVLEKYFSLNGIPVINEVPVGLRNGQNLVYTTAAEFIVGTLEVFLSGLKLNGNPADADRDYDVAVTNDGFTILLAPNKSYRLNKAPKQNEGLLVNYRKRITFNTKGGT